MKNIQEDIKTGNFKQAYLLYGEEAYLKQQYKHKLVQALNPEDDTMNFNHYEGRNIDVKELIDLCETMPFFADRRVVLLEDTGFFKNKCDELADYMKELPDYLCLIFVENEVDKRNRMYKAVKAAGRIGEFVQQDEKTLMRWAAGLLKKEGKMITQRDMELLLTMTGVDMGNLRMELEKIISYTGDRDVVTGEDIQQVCTTQTQNKIFDMVRAVTEKNQKRALDLYYDLLTLKEPPMRILFLLAKQFRQLLLVKEYAEEGIPQPVMTCMEAEKMVIPYINDQLSVTELEDFIEHIKTCENCREELEIHYMVDVGLKKLDEADGTYDIVGDLKRKLESSEAVLRRFFTFQVARYAISTLMAMALVVMFLLQLRIWKQAGFFISI